MEPDLKPEFGLTLNFDQNILENLNELQEHFGYETPAQVIGYGISCLLAIKAGASLVMPSEKLKNIKLINAKVVSLGPSLSQDTPAGEQEDLENTVNTPNQGE